MTVTLVDIHYLGLLTSDKEIPNLPNHFARYAKFLSSVLPERISSPIRTKEACFTTFPRP